jgi:hypothetical protein
MTTIGELLDRYDLGLDEADLAAVLAEALEHESRPGSVGLSPPESAFLVAHAGVSGDQGNERRGTQISDRAATELGGAIRSLATRQLARAWKIDESRVRHRARDRALYGVRLGRALRFPTWQFDENLLPLPGLPAVLNALPEGLHPIEVEGWMTSPKGDLVVDDAVTSPREWLLGGGNAAQVAHLAQAMDRW